MSRVRKAVAAVWIFAVVYNLPQFFERKVVVVPVYLPPLTAKSDGFANSTLLRLLQLADKSSLDLVPVTSRVMVKPTAMRYSKFYFLVYKTCLPFVVRFLIPFAALAFFNQRLIHAMRASSRIRQHAGGGSGGGDPKERQHTRILVVVVVVVFVICELPDLILRTSVSWSEFYGTVTAPIRTRLLYFVVVSNLFLTINSCINFVIYCFMGRRFRLILLRTIGCGGEGPPTPSVRFRQTRTLLSGDRNRPARRRQTL